MDVSSCFPRKCEHSKRLTFTYMGDSSSCVTPKPSLGDNSQSCVVEASPPSASSSSRLLDLSGPQVCGAGEIGWQDSHVRHALRTEFHNWATS